MGRRRRRRHDPADAARALPEAIAALSRTLPAAPSPEIFRRAKFDLPEAVRLAGQAAGRGGPVGGRGEVASSTGSRSLIPAGPRALAAALPCALAAVRAQRLRLARPG